MGERLGGRSGREQGIEHSSRLRRLRQMGIYCVPVDRRKLKYKGRGCTGAMETQDRNINFDEAHSR
jgi:hypothetical protein